MRERRVVIAVDLCGLRVAHQLEHGPLVAPHVVQAHRPIAAIGEEEMVVARAPSDAIDPPGVRPRHQRQTRRRLATAPRVEEREVAIACGGEARRPRAPPTDGLEDPHAEVVRRLMHEARRRDAEEGSCAVFGAGDDGAADLVHGVDAAVVGRERAEGARLGGARRDLGEIPQDETASVGERRGLRSGPGAQRTARRGKAAKHEVLWTDM